MAESKPTTTVPPAQGHEARLGDRGDASGRNIEQSRAIGQDPPRRAADWDARRTRVPLPWTPDIGTDPAQTEEAAGDEGARQ